MAVKNYGIRDQWTNLDKLNNVDIKSVDGVVESVKINGEEVYSGSWQTVFEGSVTTAEDEGLVSGEVSGIEQLTADVIKVTFNGVEYECEKITNETFEETTYIYGGVGEDGPEFSQYPFTIVSTEAYTTLFTESAGTYTLKIEE